MLHPQGQHAKGKKGNNSVQTKHVNMNYQMQKGIPQSVSKTSLNAREHQNSLQTLATSSVFKAPQKANQMQFKTNQNSGK
jgi:hypothetical protein